MTGSVLMIKNLGRELLPKTKLVYLLVSNNLFSIFKCFNQLVSEL